MCEYTYYTLMQRIGIRLCNKIVDLNFMRYSAQCFTCSNIAKVVVTYNNCMDTHEYLLHIFFKTFSSVRSFLTVKTDIINMLSTQNTQLPARV